MAKVDIQDVGSAEGAEVQGSAAEANLPALDPLTTTRSFPPTTAPPRPRPPTPWEPPAKPPTSAGGAFVKPTELPTSAKGYIYRIPGTKLAVKVPRLLTQSELDELFAKPLSADHEAMQKALDLNARVGEAARQQRETFSFTKKALSTPEAREGAKAAVFSTTATLAKTGITLGGAAMGHPFLGAAAGDVVKQGIERVTGARGGFSARELGLETLTGGFAPGPQASMTGAVVKGGLFGAGSTTLDSVITEGKIPKVGQIALGAAVGSIVTGGAHHILRSSLQEFSTADVANVAHTILSGDQKALNNLLLNSSPADREEILAIRKMLPGMTPKTGESWSIPQPAMYRGSKGFFRGYSQLRQLNPHLMTTEAPFEQGEFEFQRPTQGAMPRGSREGYFRGWFRPSKAYMGRAEYDLSEGGRKNVSTYSEMFDPIHEQNTRAIEFNNSRMAEAKAAFQGLKFKALDKFQAWLEMSDKDAANRVLQFKAGDESRAYDLDRTWDRAFKAYGLEDGQAPGLMTRSQEYLTQFLPRMRQARYDLMSRGNPEPSNAEIVSQAFPTAVPKSVQFFRDAIEKEDIGIADTNPAAMLGKHLRAGSYNTWVQQYVKDAERRFVHNPNLPDGMKRAAGYFIQQVKGGVDVTGSDLANWVYMTSKKMGHPIDQKTTRDIVNTITMAQYGGALGFRPGPLLRNYLQTWQTGFSELGPKFYMKGLLAANRQSGRILAAQLGLHAGDPGLVAEIMSQSGGYPKDMVGLTRYGFGRMIEKSLARYSGTDELNRNVMGLGQYARAIEAMGRAGGNPEKFIDYARLNTGIFQPGEREVLMNLAHDGKFMEAARRSAVGLADNTQWSYRPEARVPATTGTLGRTQMAFFNWGSFYADYLRRLALPENWKLNPKFQAARVSRFLIANGLLYGASVGLGSAAGVQDAWTRPLGWLFINPAIPSGTPPIPKQIYSGIMSLNELSAGQFGGQYQKQFLKDSAIFVPGSGLVRDFSHVMSPRAGKTRDEEILQSLGMQPGLQP